MNMKNRTWSRVITSIVLVVLVALAAVMPMVAHALSTNVVRDDGTDGSVSGNTMTKADGSVTVVGNGQVTTVSPNSNGYTVTTTTYNSNGQPVSQTTTQSETGNSGNSNSGSSTITNSKTVTLTNTTTTVTITETYTQVVTQTYEVDHYIYYYMYPIIKWTFTLKDIGGQQAPGYHSISNEKLFTPGFGGGSGIFVPVYAQEALYTLNIAPSTKPVITGWYVGKTSQSTSGPFLISQSITPPQLSNIQETVNTIQQQASYTVPNITKTTTYWNYNNGGGTTGTSPTPNPSPTNSPQQTTAFETWSLFYKAGPGAVGGNTIVDYGPGGVWVTYNTNVAQQWGSAFQSLGNAISNTLDAIGSALTNVVTAPINILTGFTNAIDNAISNGLSTVHLP
jgi:hypothetical protein